MKRQAMAIYFIYSLLSDFFFPEGRLNHTFFRKIPSLALKIANKRESTMLADEQIQCTATATSRKLGVISSSNFS